MTLVQRRRRTVSAELTLVWNTEERWRVIPDTGGRYEVSDHGRVRSLVYEPAELLKQQTHPRGGYQVVWLYTPSGRRAVKVHQAVLLAFGFARPEGRDGEQVRHKDNDPANNRLENLEWCSTQRNVDDQLAAGTHYSLVLKAQKARQSA